MKMIRIDGSRIKDELGRTLLLRGVNLGGSSKVPAGPRGATHVREGFFEHRNVSFVGRPFPLEEADEHFARLKVWGFTFLRFLVTWEAIEHAGPGLYDTDYLDYVEAVVRKAGEHGLSLFIDPHQDVWSRMSGGDGAPGWTFEAVGLDVTHFAATGAAIVHATHGDPFPRMIWPTNETKLAAATMFTLFFGGDDFAPKTRVDGEPVQSFLQRHYIDAVQQVALRLRGLDHVVGYDTLNEPSPGWIGHADLGTYAARLRLGDAPTPFQAMLLGAGFPQRVEVWALGYTGFRRRGRRWVNQERVSAWCEGSDDIWRAHGVWDMREDGQPRLLRPDYFRQVAGRAVNFVDDYLRPFVLRYARAIRSVDPDAIIFVEGAPGAPPPRLAPGELPHAVHAGHWYDGATLATKRYIPFLGADMRTGRLVLGRRRVQRSFVAQLAQIKAESAERMGDIPTLIGEFGIPFDMEGKRAYGTGDFATQIQALDDSFRAVEANLLHATLWNYTADNDNRWGDQWNDEDLSIFSRDQQADPDDLDSGGRALAAAVRPYPRAVTGELIQMRFDVESRVFELALKPDELAARGIPSEIFVPNLQYPDGYKVEVDGGRFEIDRAAQVVYAYADVEHGMQIVRICPTG